MNITIKQSEIQKKLVKAAFYVCLLSVTAYIVLYMSLLVNGISYKKLISQNKKINSEILITQKKLTNIERDLYKNTEIANMTQSNNSYFVVKKDPAVHFSYLYEND